MTVDAAVIIPCHNELENLKSVLPAVLRQSDYDDDVVVVDDGSTDGTQRWMVDNMMDSGRVHLLRRETGNTRTSFAARNYAWDRVVDRGVDMVVFLDGDCFPQDGWLDAHKDAYDGRSVWIGKYSNRPNVPNNVETGDELEPKYSLSGNISIPSNCPVRFPERFDGNYGFGDIGFGFVASLRGYTLRYLDSAVCYHYPHEVGYRDTSTNSKKFREFKEEVVQSVSE